MEYNEFLDRKTQLGGHYGFTPVFLPDYLFDFQQSLLTWAIEKGRAALFEDCGLGKTIQELVWAENVRQHTGGNVLILTPLAVAHQTAREAEKFGIDAHVSREGEVYPITITNYERLHYFSPNDFPAVICDESSILKNFDGSTRLEITIFMRKVPYRLLATATAAPNDWPELGTSSEALGNLGYMDMLAKFFKNDQNNCSTHRLRGESVKWRLKGHAEIPFWRWVCSWARAVRRPSDISGDDSRFVLPPLIEQQHHIEARTLPEGVLFAMPAVGLAEQRAEKRRTIEERCEKAAELVNHTGEAAICWCHLNPEGDLLEKLIPDAIQVSGRDSDDQKEEKLLAFTNGEVRVLVTKASIAGWGLNWQHCHHMTMFPSHSYEQYYQSIRRCWRFGQRSPVVVDTVTTDGEASILANMQRKDHQAREMFDRLVAEMNHALHVERGTDFTTTLEVPTWLKNTN